jgi:hypothetical protein
MLPRLSVLSDNYCGRSQRSDGRLLDDIEVPVQVVDPNCPIASGVPDFVLRDEVYGK